jgi:hypothetical protein
MCQGIALVREPRKQTTRKSGRAQVHYGGLASAAPVRSLARLIAFHGVPELLVVGVGLLFDYCGPEVNVDGSL